MFTPREICLLMLLPGLFGLVGLWLASLGKNRTHAAPAAWVSALSIGGAVLLAGLLTAGVPGRPREAFDWLVLLPALAMVVGMLLTWIRGVFGCVLVAGCGALSAWLLAVPGINIPDAVATAAAPGVLYALLAWPSRRFIMPPKSTQTETENVDPVNHRLSHDRWGATVPASWLIVAAATTVVSMASTGITFGKHTAALPAVLGGTLAAILMRRPVTLLPGGLAAFVLIWTSLLIYGYEWVDVPRYRVLLLLAAPLGIWLGQLPGIHRRPLIRAVLSLACVAALAATAAVPAATELLQLLSSQTQVGG